jgi:hypothetical protein
MPDELPANESSMPDEPPADESAMPDEPPTDESSSVVQFILPGLFLFITFVACLIVTTLLVGRATGSQAGALWVVFGHQLMQLPILIVWLVGTIVIVSRWDRHPAVSRLALIAIGGLFLLSIAGSFAEIWVQTRAQKVGQELQELSGRIAALSQGGPNGIGNTGVEQELLRREAQSRRLILALVVAKQIVASLLAAVFWALLIASVVMHRKAAADDAATDDAATDEAAADEAATDEADKEAGSSDAAEAPS